MACVAVIVNDSIKLAHFPFYYLNWVKIVIHTEFMLCCAAESKLSDSLFTNEYNCLQTNKKEKTSICTAIYACVLQQ